MSPAFEQVRERHDSIRIPTLWLAVGLSMLLHLAMMFGWRMHIDMLPFEDLKTGKPSGQLAIRIAPTPSRPRAEPREAVPPPQPAPKARAAPVARDAAPTARPRPAPAERVIAMNTPAPFVAPSPSPATPAAPAAAPPAEDLASMIAARRRARGDPAGAPPSPPAESEQERHNREVAENLGLTRTPSFGTSAERGGGVFQMRSISYDYAEFSFFGWNKDIKRNAVQNIEVRRAGNPSIELAVVRRMIELIRERATGDFEWQSPRTNKIVWLSARPADGAALEAFLMQEFFASARR